MWIVAIDHHHLLNAQTLELGNATSAAG